MPARMGLSRNSRMDDRLTKAFCRWMTDQQETEPAAPVFRPEPDPPPVVTEKREISPPPRVNASEPRAERPPDRIEPTYLPEVFCDSSNQSESAFGRRADSYSNTNYYEALQISPNADPETIQRVFRFMAARFHPDNPKSGNRERFLQLKEAFEVLSNPARRAHYDACRQAHEPAPLPIFQENLFVDGIEGEGNRRSGLLSLLYARRRTGGGQHGLSLLELEQQMSLPREYLEFTLWYLQAKGYVALTDSFSDYTLTAQGVDYLEANSASNVIVRELLRTNGHRSALLEPAKCDAPAETCAPRSRRIRSKRMPKSRSNEPAFRSVMPAGRVN